MAKTTIVGSPLTPALLKELGAVESFPSTPANFNPVWEWVNTYRIWTCHGYRESGNQNAGFLRIRRVRDSDKTFKLNVHEEIHQTDAIVSVTNGTVICRNNALASPIRWNVSSRLLGGDGEDVPELLNINNGTPDEGMDEVTGDWCLFEAVQRLSPEKHTSLSFDLLEGMSLVKTKHRLSYCDVHSININNEDISLHRFVQFGSGILPTEYWLDSSHRLLIVTSMNKAYILDDQAEAIFARDVERAQQSYRKRVAQRKL
ncbi:MAG: hypothetical protein JXM79_08265 [Sedimentisphaerales bacterium]|nr:hypothetical protein [Sedimentisphaerales bacterium]